MHSISRFCPRKIARFLALNTLAGASVVLCFSLPGFTASRMMAQSPAAVAPAQSAPSGSSESTPGASATPAKQAAVQGKPSFTRPVETPAQKLLMHNLIQAAEKRPSVEVTYDPTYFTLSYPMGDPPADKGVCTDEVIRCYRVLGIDLQKEVHEDMKKNFSLYPKKWGLRKTDTNIDHRRVPNLMVFFKRMGASLPVTDNPADYLPGDLVTWNLNKTGDLPHIGIVVSTISEDGQRFRIVHNMGSGPQNEDILMDYTITGHYRYYGPKSP